jgi:hypothetical protein
MTVDSYESWTRSAVDRATSQARNEEIADPFDFWRRALAGEKALKIYDGKPQCGYYRNKDRDGRYVPVAYWRNDYGDLLCRVGDLSVPDEKAIIDDLRAAEIWPWVQAEPISYELYVHVLNGGQWPDQDPAVAAHLDKKAEERRHGIGANNPPPDKLIYYRDEIASAAESAKRYKVITNDDELAASRALDVLIKKHGREAKAERDRLTAPYYKPYKEILTAWKPLLDDTETVSVALVRAQNVYETAKLRKQRAEEARAAAEAARLAAEAARRSALTEKGVRLPDLAPTIAPDSPTTTVDTQVKGAFGPAAPVRAVMIVTEITDPPTLFAFLQHDTELLVLMKKLAQRYVDAGRTVPGVTITEEARVGKRRF